MQISDRSTIDLFVFSLLVNSCELSIMLNFMKLHYCSICHFQGRNCYLLTKSIISRGVAPR